MAITTTTRFGLTQWNSGDDDFTREDLTGDHTSLGNDAAIFLAGTSSSPPVIEEANTKAFYWDRINGILYYRGDAFGSLPSPWFQIHPVIPTQHVHADLQPLNAELTALAGITTAVGLATRTASGTYQMRHIVVSGSGISVSNPFGTDGNPTISVNSTSENTASTIVYRDENGQFKIGTPTDSAHAATKAYVDTADALKANSADVYSKTDIHNARLYQYGNISPTSVDTSGAPLPSSGTRTTPRIYVQSNEPPSTGAITGDIWFQI